MAETEHVAVVTGADGGIGRALVRGLLATGISVAAVDRSQMDGLGESCKERAGGAKLLLVVADLSKDAAAEAVSDVTHTRLGKVDILVNNAGIGQSTIRLDHFGRPQRFWEVTPDQWQNFLTINAGAAFRLSRLLAPKMVERGWGRIVNVTTSLGTMMRSGYCPYGPSKAAFEALSAIMASDLAGTGVTTNVLVPGGVTNTGMVPPEAGFERASLLQPEIMFPPLAWLVSDLAAAVNGRRFLAAHWDASLSPEQAAAKAGADVAWTSLGVLPITPKAIGSA